jgi:hypothetical protein
MLLAKPASSLIQPRQPSFVQPDPQWTCVSDPDANEIRGESLLHRFLSGPIWLCPSLPAAGLRQTLSLTSPVKLTARLSVQIEKATAHSNSSPADQSRPGNSVERL